MITTTTTCDFCKTVIPVGEVTNVSIQPPTSTATLINLCPTDTTKLQSLIIS